jgi:hypothetical protein
MSESTSYNINHEDGETFTVRLATKDGASVAQLKYGFEGPLSLRQAIPSGVESTSGSGSTYAIDQLRKVLEVYNTNEQPIEIGGGNFIMPGPDMFSSHSTKVPWAGEVEVTTYSKKALEDLTAHLQEKGFMTEDVRQSLLGDFNPPSSSQPCNII